MEKIYKYLENLIKIPTVTGFEAMGVEKAAKLSMDFTDGFFDRYEVLTSGSILFTKKCGISGAKKLVVDAHIDTIGFAVSQHSGNGFLKVVSLGGTDPYILPSSIIQIHGKETLYGVFSSVPPHLISKKDNDKIKVSDLFVDTGLTAEEAERLFPVGTPCTYAEKTTLLQNNVVASAYLDNKACCAAVMKACQLLKEENSSLSCDLYVHFSAGEEKSQLGAKTLPYFLENADGCIVLDVNFAKADGIKEYESLVMGKGTGISYSSSIKRELTDFIAETANKNDIPLQTVVEMRSTGTNATHLHRNGIPCAVLSVPLKNMHTYSECVSLYDIESCAKLLARVISNFHKCKNVGIINIK